MRNKKCLKCFAMILLTLNASIHAVSISLYAREGKGNYEKQNKSEGLQIDAPESFVEERERYRFTNKKIEEEIEHQSGYVNAELEQYLNENGVFDSDIEVMGLAQLGDIEECDIENIQVYAGYYAIEDTIERAGETVTEDEMIPLTPEEVDELIGVEYYEDEAVNNNMSSTVPAFFETIGIESVCASAKDETKGGIDDKENYSLLKKIVIVYPGNGKMESYYRVAYSCIWTKMPVYTNLDVVSLKWSGAYFDNESINYNESSVSQRWIEDKYFYVAGTNTLKLDRTITNKNKVFSYYANPGNLKAGQYFVGEDSMCCAVKLHEEKETGIHYNFGYDVKECYNESIAMIVYLKRDKKFNNLILYPYYLHSKTSWDLGTVAVNILTGGYINAVYNLVSGKVASVSTEYSGIEWPFSYNYITYK